MKKIYSSLRKPMKRKKIYKTPKHKMRIIFRKYHLKAHNLQVKRKGSIDMDDTQKKSDYSALFIS